MRATMSVGPPAAKETIHCTGRDGYISADAARDRAGSAAALAAKCRKFRRGSFTALPPEIRQASHTSFRLDVRRLDDRPPLLDLGLLLGGERLWRLLLARPDSLAQVGEPLAYQRI